MLNTKKATVVIFECHKKMYLLMNSFKMLGYIIDSVVSPSSSTIFRLMTTACCILIFMLQSRKNKFGRKDKLSEAPGPKPWPIIGSLHLMAAAQMEGKVPYAAFTELKKIFGNVFSITLGTTKCVVINDAESVREVLIHKDKDFDGRPDFKRFDALFGGDKQNCKFLVHTSYSFCLVPNNVYSQHLKVHKYDCFSCPCSFGILQLLKAANKKTTTTKKVYFSPCTVSKLE